MNFLRRVTPSSLKPLLRRVRDRAAACRERVLWGVRKRRTIRRVVEPLTLPPGDAGRDTILVFAPYAGVGPLFAAACVLAKTLQDCGHRVLVARCYRLFERCAAMDNARLPYAAPESEVSNVCLGCAANSFDMTEAYGLESIDLRAFVTPEVGQRVRQALSAAPANLLDFKFDGQAIGKLSAVDLVLAKKISNLDNVPEAIRAAWLQHIAGGVLAYITVDEICRRYRVTRFLHVPDYGLGLAGMLAAGKHGAKSYGASLASHRNVDFRRYILWPDVWKPSSFVQLAAWPECRELALPSDQVREIAEDLLVRLGGVGSHIYSPAKTAAESDPRSRWGLASDRKLLVAYTSSLDEVVATRLGLDGLGLTVPQRAQPFGSQSEWLEALVEYVSRSDHLQLAVRVHPREGATKHSTLASEHLRVLREKFSLPRPHCRFVWPEDPISSYDLAEAADLALTSWSTIGLEVARLGVPVLVAFNGSWAAMPQDDFLEWGATPAEYFRKLEMLLDAPVSLARIVRAFRWYNLYHLGAAFDLSDIVPSSTYTALPNYRLPAEARAIEEVIVHGREACDINVKRLRTAQRSESAGDESAELRRQMRRQIHFLLTGEDSTVDVPLHFAGEAPGLSSSGCKPEDSGMSRRIEVRGAHVRYWPGMRSGRDAVPRDRFSPMIARLAPLCASNVPEGRPSVAGGGTKSVSD